MSAFEARHISPNVKKAIFKKIEALNKLGLGGNKSGLDIKAGDTINATPSFSEESFESSSTCFLSVSTCFVKGSVTVSFVVFSKAFLDPSSIFPLSA